MIADHGPLTTDHGQRTNDMKTKLILLTTCSLLTLSALAADDGFKPLFNGKDTGGWHLRRKDGHNSWTVANGVLKKIQFPISLSVSFLSVSPSLQEKVELPRPRAYG